MFRTSDAWPRTKALYCHPVPLADWPAEPDVVEEVAVRSCVRRGAAIDLVLDRARENRSQLVYTKARGRDVVFWQSPRTRKQARPNVRTPTARAAGMTELEIVVDAHERYAWQFAGQSAVRTVKRALPCGDYGVTVDDRLVAAVERKSLDDLTSSLSSGRLRFALAELAGLPRAAVVVEDRWSSVFKQRWVRPSVMAEAIAELQVRWPGVPVVFCDTRALAEEWTYRFLAAAAAWARTEEAAAALALDGATDPVLAGAPAAPEASTAEVRRWAREAGLPVADGGRLRPEIWAAWRASREAQSPSAGNRAE